MERININDIQIIKKTIDYGSFSDIHEVLYNNEKYAFKQFNDQRINANFLIEKYDELNAFNLNNSLIPNIFVEDGELNGFLIKLYNHKCFSFLYDCPIDLKIKLLKQAKTAMLEVHSRDIIHGDIHPSNFLFRTCLLIDFDNSQFKNFKLNPEFVSKTGKKFLNAHKLSKDLDKYLFNYMTFSILNNSPYEPDKDKDKPCAFVEVDISNKEYGVFKSKEAIKICKSLLLEDKIFNTDLLIDTVDSSLLSKEKKI